MKPFIVPFQFMSLLRSMLPWKLWMGTTSMMQENMVFRLVQHHIICCWHLRYFCDNYVFFLMFLEEEGSWLINQLTSVFYASVLLLMINFVITLSKCYGSTSCTLKIQKSNLYQWKYKNNGPVLFKDAILVQWNSY